MIAKVDRPRGRRSTGLKITTKWASVGRPPYADNEPLPGRGSPHKRAPWVRPPSLVKTRPPTGYSNGWAALTECIFTNREKVWLSGAFADGHGHL